MDDPLSGLPDIDEIRVESLRRVSDYVLAAEEASYNDALEKCGGQPIGHVYLHALVLNEWLAELDKSKKAG
jgi:hypothetical protein